MKRIFLVVPILAFALASATRAEFKPPWCVPEYKEYLDAKFNTPERDAAQKIWEKCLALANEQEKAEFSSTRDTWAASLDKLPNGGWAFLRVDAKGTNAIFGSHTHATREGNIVALWLRYEYREAQTDQPGLNYKSFVEREIFDCGNVKYKIVAEIYYSESNLGGVSRAPYEYDEAKVGWTAAIPGTLGDSLLDWACKAAPRAKSPRAK